MEYVDYRLAPQDFRRAAIVSMILGTIYLFTSSLQFHSIDEIAVFATARSLVGHGSFDADTLYWVRQALQNTSLVAVGTDGHAYAVKGGIVALLASPLVWLAQVSGTSPVRAALLFSPAITALTGGLIVLMSLRQGASQRVALCSGLLFGLGTLAWPYAETLFTEPLAALGLTIALWALWETFKRPRWQTAAAAGCGMGLVGLSVVALWVILIVIGIGLIWHTWRTRHYASLAGFTSAIAVFLVMQGLYNALRFGSPLETGYQQVGVPDFSLAGIPTGLIGQIISTPRGLVWYVPLSVLAVTSLPIQMKGSDRFYTLITLGVITVTVGLYSSYRIWPGGISWGPRFLVPLMPLLVLLVQPALQKVDDAPSGWRPAAIGLICVLSILIQFTAAAFDTVTWEIPVAAEFDSLIFEEERNTYLDASVLWNTDHLPFTRAIKGPAVWDTLWLTRDRTDFLLLSSLVIVIAAGSWILLSKATPTRVMGLFIATLGITALMMTRYPQGPNYDSELAGAIRYLDENSQAGDAVLTLLSQRYFAWLDMYHSQPPDTGLSMADPLPTLDEVALTTIIQRDGTLWVVSEGTYRGDPANGQERWLTTHVCSGMETQVGPLRVVPYRWPDRLSEWQPVEQVFGDGALTLSGFAYEEAPEYILIELRWDEITPDIAGHMIFVHLLGTDGQLIAQHDGPLLNSHAGTARQVHECRYVILPDEGGWTQIRVGLYDPVSGARLSLVNGEESYLMPISPP